MKVIEVVFLLGLAAIAAALAYQGMRALVARLSRHREQTEPWRVTKHPTSEGGWDVCVERPGERRVVQALPPAPSLDMQTDLALALDDAKREAKLLNKR